MPLVMTTSTVIGLVAAMTVIEITRRGLTLVALLQTDLILVVVIAMKEIAPIHAVLKMTGLTHEVPLPMNLPREKGKLLHPQPALS